MPQHPFVQFLEEFIPKVEAKNKQLNKALWLLETTGSSDAADLKTELETEYKLFFNDEEIYRKLQAWDKDPSLTDPLLKRQLDILLRAFKQNMIEPNLLKKITEKESELLLSYANFRPTLDNKILTENEIREVLKKEESPNKRKRVWETSKLIGNLLAPQILQLVKLRNRAATSLGYSDYFTMQLDLQEVNSEWLFDTFEKLAQDSEKAYSDVVKSIENEQIKRFKVKPEELGPWAWSDPFCQEDPLDSAEMDTLVKEVDIIESSVKFFKRMGIDINPILKSSDMFERAGKNQHAFCINIDRKEDVRTLNNVKETIKWLEVVLHEFGHAIYELGFDQKLPWLLREPAHTFTTESMALIAGRQAYRYDSLPTLIEAAKSKLMQRAEESLRRRQLIFSRWVLVMTHFEKELYSNPEQDLNALWWKLVKKYQKINTPPNRAGNHDWAAKYHVGLAPVYYFSYLLGEMLASSIEEKLLKITGSKNIDTHEAGQFLQQKLFKPGCSMKWSDLIKHVTGESLRSTEWIHQFAK